MAVKTYKAEVFDSNKYRLGEGPFYTKSLNRLSWIDILDGRVYTLINGKKEYTEMGQHIGAAIPMKDSDGFIVAGYDGLYTLENGEKKLLYRLDKELKDHHRCNDARMDKNGRIWFGSIVDNFYDIECYGGLYVYDKGVVKCAIEDTKLANGLVWSLDEKTFYFIDTNYGAVFKYDYDAINGEISNRQEFIRITDGFPDGMCIDSNDDLWIAIWDGGKVHHRDGRTGELKGVVEVDAKNVSSCCFYGDNMDMLFITTSGEYASGEHDGCIFTCKVDAKGA